MHVKALAAASHISSFSIVNSMVANRLLSRISERMPLGLESEQAFGSVAIAFRPETGHAVASAVG
jgi:hypothetical protein